MTLQPLGTSSEDRPLDRYRSQVTEVVNRNTVVSLALRQGYNAFLPVYDGGVDFILYHEVRNDVRRVQLKGRWTIDKKYEGRKIWVAFPIVNEGSTQWYLMPHDDMVRLAESDGVTATDSWITGGAYSRPRPSAAVIAQCARYKLEAIAAVTDQAASEGAAVSDTST